MLAVDVKNLTVQFGDFKAVNDISFGVNQGEIFGFLGANGAGKTTTIRVLCGLLKPSSGEIFLNGERLQANSQLIKQKTGYMSQRFTLYDDLTVAENLSFTANLRGLDRKLFNERKTYLLDFIAFKEPLSTLVKNLPGGIKQQVSLVTSILHDPEVIFLDEPTAGVTPAHRARFWSLIKELASSKKTVFVTSHYMDEVEQCGRIALMQSGKLIAMDSALQLKKAQFPNGMYELSVKKELDSKQIDYFKTHPLLELFEPYGVRYHTCVRETNDWEKVKTELSKYFEIKAIAPSLEDVFIKLVEERK